MKEFIKFINQSPTSFQAVTNIKKKLLENGYIELDEKETFKLKKGEKYFATRNGSSIIALNVGKKLTNPSLQVCASHSDCPSFKVKPEALIFSKNSLQLNTEVYGGPLYYPWLDRPLSLAGRVIVKDEDGVKSVDYMDKDPFCIIPSVAIHFNREANNGLKFNPQVDLLPLISMEDNDFKVILAKKLKTKKEDVLGFDLYLYPVQEAYIWGVKKEFVSSFHIDNLECAYGSLVGFINNFNDENINVYACFDNEEVGSLSYQGADSDFFVSTLQRVSNSLDLDYYALLGRGMLLSCDNAHAAHPNHPEKSDPVNRPYMNGGVVIKFNANQTYTTDGYSASILKDLLDTKKVPYQSFTNRSDTRGGGTLGNISNGHVSLKSVDIGLAQLAMHSPLETAGSKDLKHLEDCCREFYGAHLSFNGDSCKLR